MKRGLGQTLATATRAYPNGGSNTFPWAQGHETFMRYGSFLPLSIGLTSPIFP